MQRLILMGQAIKLTSELISDATIQGKAHHRSPPKQIEYWARMGKLAEENPDLPLEFIKNILIGIEEEKAGLLTEYQFS